MPAVTRVIRCSPYMTNTISPHCCSQYHAPLCSAWDTKRAFGYNVTARVEKCMNHTHIHDVSAAPSRLCQAHSISHASLRYTSIGCSCMIIPCRHVCTILVKVLANSFSKMGKMTADVAFPPPSRSLQPYIFHAFAYSVITKSE